MGNELLLAVDIGTSATKALLFDTDLNLKAACKRSNLVLEQAGSRSEQNPADLFDGVLDAMIEALQARGPSDRLAGVVFSSQMYSVLAVDSQGMPLTNSLTWLDGRAAGTALDLRRHGLAQQVSETTGCPIDSVFPLSKIIWLKEHSHLPGDARFISVKEYVLYRLTGQYLVDWTIGSGSGLMDIRRNEWDPSALSLAGIEPKNLSALASPCTMLTEWEPSVVEKLGISADTPIILGSGDGPLASVGVGALTPDVLAVNVGTSAAARCVISSPMLDPGGHLYTQVLDRQHWVMGGMTSSGGIIHEWFLEQFCASVGQESTPHITSAEREAVEQMASRIPPGSDGLLFVPYLCGEQSPGWQPSVRGSFLGLRLDHTRAHLARAVLEGIARSIYQIAAAFQQVPCFEGVQFREVRVTGGLSASPLWLQIMADMFGLPIVVPDLTDGSARGAAILGWSALGGSDRLAGDASPFQVRARAEPRDEAHTLYQQQPYEHDLDCIRGARY